VFYPIIAWGDVSTPGAGLTLITHGLQGLGGTSTLNLLLVRQVSDGGRPTSEGLTDREPHTLRYAYAPHTGSATAAQPWIAAAAFNQPLIPVWRASGYANVQLPFDRSVSPRSLTVAPASRILPASFSLIAADSGSILDLYRRGDQIDAIIFDAEPDTPATISSAGSQHRLLPAPFTIAPVMVAPP
jgi:hypothetical protein